MTCSLTPAGVPRAGAKYSPFITYKTTKNDEPFENMRFNGKTV